MHIITEHVLMLCTQNYQYNQSVLDELRLVKVGSFFETVCKFFWKKSTAGKQL